MSQPDTAKRRLRLVMKIAPIVALLLVVLDFFGNTIYWVAFGGGLFALWLIQYLRDRHT